MVVAPKVPGQPCEMVKKETTSDLIFTAETHNMPTAVAPFSGATTGTGGRIRDVEGVGRGGHTIAGTAGYSVGNLLIPGSLFVTNILIKDDCKSHRLRKFLFVFDRLRSAMGRQKS